MAVIVAMTLSRSNERSSLGRRRLAASFSALVLLNTVLIAGRPIRSTCW